MKSTLLLVLGAITASVVASPTSDRLGAPGLLEPRDKYCRLHDDVTPPGHCRSCTSTECPKVRDISKSDRFGVSCYVMSDPANNNFRWDYIPGWNCYVSASITNPDCEEPSEAESCRNTLKEESTKRDNTLWSSQSVKRLPHLAGFCGFLASLKFYAAMLPMYSSLAQSGQKFNREYFEWKVSEKSSAQRALGISMLLSPRAKVVTLAPRMQKDFIPRGWMSTMDS
ncbi:hypothetical protein FS837_004365 [Tulasnella sp. UAMH 9824]|nr:hypothetical protein FS837_004365 [Tulasnella sp. UAMH 9824]